MGPCPGAEGECPRLAVTLRIPLLHRWTPGQRSPRGRELWFSAASRSQFYWVMGVRDAESAQWGAGQGEHVGGGAGPASSRIGSGVEAARRRLAVALGGAHALDQLPCRAAGHLSGYRGLCLVNPAVLRRS